MLLIEDWFPVVAIFWDNSYTVISSPLRMRMKWVVTGDICGRQYVTQLSVCVRCRINKMSIIFVRPCTASIVSRCLNWLSVFRREPVDEVLQMPPSLLMCGGCQQSIGDRFFLKAIEQYWHEDCLSCDLCGCRLGEVGRRLYYKLGRKLCRRDYLRLVWTL